MTVPKIYNVYLINVMLALVISLIINFSYLLAIRQQDFSIRHNHDDETMSEGILHISRDGYGYIIPEIAPEIPAADGLTVRDSVEVQCPVCDSIYVSWRNISHLELKDGSRMSVMSRSSRIPGGNRALAMVLEVDGKPFDYGEAYSRPNDNLLFGLQFGFYFLMAFILLSIMTIGVWKNTSIGFYMKRAGFSIVAAVVLYFLIPVMQFRTEDIVPGFMNTWNGSMIIDPFTIMKCSFVLILVLLYARTYQMIYQKEDIMLENEQLKNENLRARYNTLINQINPHFLFNSLNSLSSLVREQKTDDAVTYIDRLSDTFRYTIQNEPHTTTTLHDELEFAEAYTYLLEVRYAEKLFVDIDVDPAKTEWRLPTFSIQPLIENAVKHNTITRAKPLRITIRTEGDYLVVSNAVNPKIAPEKGTGIGLENLSNRWLLLTGKNIEVTDDGAIFSVRLPFITTITQ